MKKLSILMLSLLAFPTYGQSLLGPLKEHQSGLPGKSSSKKERPGVKPEVKPTAESISSTSKKCEEDDQTSLPLAYITSLIQEKDGDIEIIHDARSGSLNVSSPDMIGNCSSMIEWSLKQPEIQGAQAYALEAKIKKGQNCDDKGCTYKVAKMKDGAFDKYEEVVVQPTLKGFEECLKQSGVFENGKFNETAVYNTPISEKFSGLDYSGQILFLSHGPASPIIKAKHGKFTHVDGCDYYEGVGAEDRTLLTLEDAQRIRLDEEASKLRECKVDEYQKLADFIEKYEDYSADLGEIRDRLILEAAQKSAKAIAAGKYTDDDMKVLADFEKYIVQPKVDLARALYEEAEELDGDALKAKQEELKVVLADLNTLYNKPYFTEVELKKLLADGQFEQAQMLNNIRLTLDNHRQLGSKVKGNVITPAVASQNIVQSRLQFREWLGEEKVRFEYRTGQVTGKAAYYTSLATNLRNNTQVRYQNYYQEILIESENIQQPNGHCFKYWVNTQVCVNESMQRMQQLGALLEHFNKVDTQRAAEFDVKAKEWAALEAEGQRYLAAQGGGEAVQDTTLVADTESASLTPEKRQGETQTQPGVYNFNYQGQSVNQQAQMTPNLYQYPMNGGNQNYFQQQPQSMYSMYQSQNFQNTNQNTNSLWMGQNSYGMNNNTFGFNAQMGYGYQQPQPQQQFWQQPTMSNGQYSLYSYPYR